MTNIQTFEPKLRFGRDGVNYAPLQSKCFEDIFAFSTGKNIKQAEASPEFTTPCVRYGELYHMYDEVITAVINRTNVDESELMFSDGDEILLPSAGEDPLDIGSASALTIKNVAIGRTINVLKPKETDAYDQRFVSYYINQILRKKISTLARGASISNVYNSDLRKLNIHLPTLPEQRKIADFLMAVDERIQQLIQKKALLEDYKKGVMQQIFTQAIRFKDDHGNDFPDWEEIELGEVLGYEQPNKYIVKSTEYSDEHTTPVLTAGKTFVLGYTDEDEGICNTGLPLIIFDDFTTAYKFVDFPFKVKSSAMKILRTKDNSWDIRFVHNAMSTIRFPRGEHKRYWIGEYQFMSIPAPSLAEQTKIANFLSAIERKIESVATQITETQNFKRGLLQQMFV